MFPATLARRLPACLLFLALSIAAAAQEWKRLSPFEALAIEGDVVKVRVAGAPYECLAIDGVAVGEILGHARAKFGDRWEKRFAEDLVEVLAGMGHAPGPSVALKLRDASGVVIERDTAMTAENRMAIWRSRQTASAAPSSASAPAPEARRERVARPDPARKLTAAEAAEDLAALSRAIEDTHSYARVAGIDAKAALETLRSRLGDSPTIADLGLGIAAELARLGDCHARVRGLSALLPRGCTPFRMEEVEGRIVAFAADDALLDPERPFVVAIDGSSIGEWLALAKRTVPACSESFVRTHALERLSFLAHLRAEAGRPPSAIASVTLASADGASRTLNLPLADRPPRPRDLPPTSRRMLPDGIGYLRIASMDDGPEFTALLREAMAALAGMRGLVIDVRGNGGGSREALKTLMPLLMRADESPRVVNVAAYRLPSDERPERPEGHLDNRFLYPLTWPGWSPAEREAIGEVAKSFRPAWTPPSGEFTAWHYFVISPGGDGLPRFGGPVAVLMDGDCFSATDIFLGALKGRPGVTLIGTPSGGGSGRARGVDLPHSGLEVMLSTMASFRPDGSRYDGVGIAPDVVAHRTLDDALGRSDSLLDAAVARLQGGASPAAQP